MEDPADLAKRYKKIKEKLWGLVLSFLLFCFPKEAHTTVLYLLAGLAICFLITTSISSIFDFNNILNFRKYLLPPEPISPVLIEKDDRQYLVSTTVENEKVKSVMSTPCNTKNNFEPTIWKRNNFRVITTNNDSGDPEYVGAIQKEPFQSLMIYPFDCPLPLIATISATIRSEKSIGLIFEYGGVFQIVVGDGDKKAIRYKIDTQGIRNFGWVYVKHSGKTLTRWLKYDGIAFGSQVDLTVKITPRSENTLSVVSAINYRTSKSPYQQETLESLDIDVQSFNLQQNNGRQIRVGVNDREGLSEIKFDQFFIESPTVK